MSDRELTAIQQSSSSNPSDVDDIALTLDTPPCQPTPFKFPTTKFSGKERSFSAGWFDHYGWLEYSIENDAAYCYSCRTFGSSSIGSCRPEKAFTITGFRNWNHATGSNMLLMRNNSIAHKQATVAWEQYKSIFKTGSIADQLGNKREEMIQKNQNYVKTVAEVLLFCSQQDVPFWGHDESLTSANRGNFKEFLYLIAKHDPVVAEKLKNGPKNAVHTSPKIRNDIVHIMANIVRQQIQTHVQQSGYCSILADETKDITKQEQLSIVLRYVDHDGQIPSVVERFLTFVVASNLKAEHLSKYILDTLSLFNLDTN